MRVFGFARRRRHTRYWRDWSSDVCSSDLRSLSIEGHTSAQGALDVTDRADQPATRPISPLRQRLLEDMAMHGLRDATRRRSEERRVGIDGRSRWSPYHSKKRAAQSTLGSA